mmetsp:Transcript_37422/g.117952  ORF Transcript_37422/g.117952 Transcript_37422/m.117952 type:complete len:229 (-) Transcript_37422:685-1371(-)
MQLERASSFAVFAAASASEAAPRAAYSSGEAAGGGPGAGASAGGSPAAAADIPPRAPATDPRTSGVRDPAGRLSSMDATAAPAAPTESAGGGPEANAEDSAPEIATADSGEGGDSADACVMIARASATAAGEAGGAVVLTEPAGGAAVAERAKETSCSAASGPPFSRMAPASARAFAAKASAPPGTLLKSGRATVTLSAGPWACSPPLSRAQPDTSTRLPCAARPAGR